MTRLCSVDGCDQRHEAKGFCKRHWHRWNRHGDPLAGGSIRAAAVDASRQESLFILETVLGGGKDGECVVWPFRLDTKGYAITRIGGVRVYVPTIVCRFVNGPSPSPKHEVAHSCGKGHLACIAPEHLRWATRKENQIDSILHNSKNRGERSGTNKLIAADVLTIFALRENDSAAAVATRFGVSPSQVRRIFKQIDWAWLTSSARAGAVATTPASGTLS